jgi:hypothetical protein
MERISVPEFEPCGQCANGNVLRNGRTEKCRCWLSWWDSVRAMFTPDGAQTRKGAA